MPNSPAIQRELMHTDRGISSQQKRLRPRVQDDEVLGQLRDLIEAGSPLLLDRRTRAHALGLQPMTTEKRKDRVLAAAKRGAYQTQQEWERIDRLDMEVKKLTKKGKHHHG